MIGKKIGIFGGSFNPIHTGHIALAKSIRQKAGLDEVWLMVSPQNPLKQEAELLSDDLRLKMARLAVEGEEGIVASDFEFHLPRPSYTHETLRQLSNTYPDHTFVLLIGGDNWAHFERWRHWQDILRDYDVVVYPRDEHPGTIDAQLLPISSTDIRALVKGHKKITGLVPPVIESLVEEYYR